MNKKKIISTTSLFAVAAIAVFTISPYFYDVTVDEALPTASAKLPSGTFIGSGDGIHEAEGDVLSLKLEDGFDSTQSYSILIGPASRPPSVCP